VTETMIDNEVAKESRNRTYSITLAVIIILAAIIRSYHIRKQGLIYWDEGLFIMGARFLHWRSSAIWLEMQNSFHPALGQLSNLYVGLPVFLQKPVHVILLTIWNLPGWNEVYSAVSFSIFSSLLSILLTAELGRRFFNSSTALFAAAWLAVQPYHVHYSRLAMHEMDSMALFLTTILLWHVMNRKNSFLFAIVTGCFAVAALGASYRYLPYLLLGSMMEIFISLTSKLKLKQILRRWIGIISGAFITLFLLDKCYHVVFSPDYLWSQPDSYIKVLGMKFLGGESSFDIKFPWFYFRMLGNIDGWIPLFVMLAGWFTLIMHKRTNKWILLIFTTVPFILFSLTTTRVPRTITGLLPFFALSVGYMFYRLTTLLKKNCSPAKFLSVSIITSIFLLVCMISHLNNIWKLESGYPEIIDWFKKENVKTHLSTMPPIYAAYQGRTAVKPVPFTIQEIHDEVEKSRIRYLTVDWQKFLRYSSGVLQIEKAVLPVFAVHHNPGSFFPTLHENHLPGDVENLRKDPTIAYVKVYDLYEALPATGYPLSFLEQE